MSDPYSWAFPSKKDTMSLQTISQKDTGFTKPKQINGPDYSLKVNDISGAQPCMKPYQFTNKPDFTNRLDDIDGTKSRVLIREKGRETCSLNCRDIKGTQPQMNKFQTNRPPANPVDPVYIIPYSEPIEPTIPKFIRDQMNVDDIRGTKPCPSYSKLRKTVHQFEEIQGTKSKPAFIPRDHMEIMDVRDINEYRVFKSSRITNPLQPEYQLKNEEGEPINYGFVKGSVSRMLHPLYNKPYSTSLVTHDLEGCHSGTVTDHFLMRQVTSPQKNNVQQNQKRTNYRQINEVNDIPGANVGSLRKGLVNKRGTNPLNPVYQMPGNTEIYPDLPGLQRQTSALVIPTQPFHKINDKLRIYLDNINKCSSIRIYCSINQLVTTTLRGRRNKAIDSFDWFKRNIRFKSQNKSRKQCMYKKMRLFLLENAKYCSKK